MYLLTYAWVCLSGIHSLAISYANVRSEDIDQYTHTLTCVTRDLFKELDQKVSPVAPLQFLSVSSL